MVIKCKFDVGDTVEISTNIVATRRTTGIIEEMYDLCGQRFKVVSIYTDHIDYTGSEDMEPTYKLDCELSDGYVPFWSESWLKDIRTVNKEILSDYDRIIGGA